MSITIVWIAALTTVNGTSRIGTGTGTGTRVAVVVAREDMSMPRRIDIMRRSEVPVPVAKRSGDSVITLRAQVMIERVGRRSDEDQDSIEKPASQLVTLRSWILCA
jgi:hypothetical protein